MPEMDAFATAGELESKLKTTFDGKQVLWAGAALERATAIVRAATGQHISPPVEAVREWYDTSRKVLFLPHPPAIPVTDVTVEVNEEEIDGWRIDRLHVLTSPGGRFVGDVKVTYTHGAEEPHPAAVEAVLAIASREWDNPRGHTQKSVGDVSVSMGSQAVGPHLSEFEMALLDPLVFAGFA